MRSLPINNTLDYIPHFYHNSVHIFPIQFPFQRRVFFPFKSTETAKSGKKVHFSLFLGGFNKTYVSAFLLKSCQNNTILCECIHYAMPTWVSTECFVPPPGRHQNIMFKSKCFEMRDTKDVIANKLTQTTKCNRSEKWQKVEIFWVWNYLTVVQYASL